MVVNRMWNAQGNTLTRMAGPTDLKKVLWENVSDLMKERWGDENLQQLARAAKLGPGTAQRIKEQDTSVGLDTLSKIAHCFRVAAYELIMERADRHVIRLIRAWHDTDERGRMALEFGLDTAERRMRRRANQTGETNEE